MIEDEFHDIDIDQPKSGEYCEIIIVSRFKAWYLPECHNWPWIMDDDFAPNSEVTEWRKSLQKDDYDLL